MYKRQIQESPTVYNLIREFTRNFHCRFIVTGSYLGRTLNTEFKLSAGDLKSLRIETLDFEEFTEAFGLHEAYEGMGLYGTQHPEELARLSELFGLYLEIGGYPAVVTEYLETESTEKSREKLEYVIHLFCTESTRYFEDILDTAVYDNIFCCVARILAREKRDWRTISAKACKNWSCMIMTATSASLYATAPSCGCRAPASLISPAK